jgi:hypothetical protein
MIPSFSTFNFAGGMFITGLFILGVWYTNTWNTAYLPINSNRIYDHYGQLYNVSQALDPRGMFDLAKYSKYSAPYMSAANSLVYGFFFAIYAAVVTHVLLYHRYELRMGFKNLVKGLRWRRNKNENETEGEQGTERANEGEYLDVHNRLMAAYPEGNQLFAQNKQTPVRVLTLVSSPQCPSGSTLAPSSSPSSLASSASPSGRRTLRPPSCCTASGCASCLSCPSASWPP